MAQILIRDIEDDVKAGLRRLAKRHGRSMEEEVREILRSAALTEKAEPTKGLGTEIAELFRGIGLKEGEEIQELRGWTITPPDFGE